MTDLLRSFLILMTHTMKIVRMVDFFERKFERKEENDFGMLFGITGFMLGGIRFILIGIILV